MSKRVYLVEEKNKTSWWIIFPAAFLIVHWQVMFFLVLGISLLWLALQYAKWASTHNDVKEIKENDFALRADYENMMYLQEGDIYGQYQPVTMPTLGRGIKTERIW